MAIKTNLLIVDFINLNQFFDKNLYRAELYLMNLRQKFNL